MLLPDVRTFLAVASAGSLSAAARQLDVVPMQVSRRIAALEEDLGVRLFHRTTRSLTLTAEGEAFIPYARAMADAETGARAELGPSPGSASGVLRMTAPSGFGQSVVLPMLPALLEANPDLRIDIDLSDRQVDIVGQGLDVALRIAPLEDSELDDHACIRLSAVRQWPLIVNGALIRKHVDAFVTTTSVEAARTAAVQGLGLAQLTYWDVFRQLADKSLEQIHLEDATMEDLSVWAVMPSRRYVPNRVSVFLDALRNQIAELGRSLGRAP